MEHIKKNLGFGFMRLPMKDGEIDLAETTKWSTHFWLRGSIISTRPTAIYRARARQR